MMSKTSIYAILFVGVLWAAFAGMGLRLHHACRDAPKNHLGWTDIAGYDSEAYVTHFTSPIGLVEVNHRHPWMGAATAPITIVGITVACRLGREVGYQAVIVCFALLGAFTAYLLWMAMRRSGATRWPSVAAMALWLSFGHVWILGGVAETFNVSMAILTVVLLMVIREVRDFRAWLAVSALAGFLTVTNFFKPIAAWLVAADGLDFVRRLSRRTILRIVLVSFAALTAIAVALACKWTFIDGFGAQAGFEYTVEHITRWIPSDMPILRRLWLTWNTFWCEPMLLRDLIINRESNLHPYPSPWPHLLGALVLAGCLWSAIRNFRLPVIRAALAMVALDFLLHVVVGWGIEEGQIYCGHWFWIIPLLLAHLPAKTAPLTFGLAVGIAVSNLSFIL